MSGLPILILLIVAHALGDFLLQPAKWVDERYARHFASPRLYAHASIHGILALSVLWLLQAPSSDLLLYAAIIAGTHFVIDLAKSYTPPGRLTWFILDQALHLLVIAFVWFEMTDQWIVLDMSRELLLKPHTLLVLGAYVIVLWPFSIVIGLVCNRWAGELDGFESLANAGKTIGQLERFLILTFILAEQFTAIGFLLAAKSILRFGDTREPDHRKINEYVLVGTMISFSITIAFGVLVKGLLEAL